VKVQIHDPGGIDCTGRDSGALNGEAAEPAATDELAASKAIDSSLWRLINSLELQARGQKTHREKGRKR
jgi:hypothetical protein